MCSARPKCRAFVPDRLFDLVAFLSMTTIKEHNPASKYLKVDEFVSYCKKCNVDVSISMLESYEKVGLLFPIYRIVVPDEYVRAVFEYNHRIPIDHNIPFDVDGEWREIDELADALSSYRLPKTPYLEQVLKNGHPLDYAYISKNRFLYKPALNSFKPWEEYKIDAGTIDGYPIKEDTVEHYYSPWQIFVVENLNERHTILENYVAGLRQGWGIFNKEISPSKILEYSELFQTVSNFRMIESLIWFDMTFDLKKSFIERELLEKILKEIKTVAKKEYEKHVHTGWINFIRKLVELFTKYFEEEKIKLSNELKSFLSSSLNMIMYATQKSFEEISDEYDGRFKGVRMLCLENNIVIYPGKLDKIFPDELKQSKERSLLIVEVYINELNKTLHDDAKIDAKVKEELIDNIIGCGHEIILSHLHELRKFWFNREPHWRSSIWAHIRSLTISIESIGQEWYKKRSRKEIFKSVFNEDYDDFRKVIGEKITDAEKPDEFKQKLTKILEYSKKDIKRIYGYHFVIAHLTRNYLSHNVQFDPEMLGSLFVEVYKSLVFTLISLFVKKEKDNEIKKIEE